MVPTATADLEPAARERSDYAGAGLPRPPHSGRAGDHTIAGEVPARALPRARNVLAVIARPGQESAELGAMLHTFRRGGARLTLLCLTRGEASPLNSTCERLETIRPFELHVAAGLLGVSSVRWPIRGAPRFCSCPSTC